MAPVKGICAKKHHSLKIDKTERKTQEICRFILQEGCNLGQKKKAVLTELPFSKALHSCPLLLFIVRRFLSGAKLGLRICKLICRRAGWKLTLTARPGGGARAQVVFPLASCEDIPPEMELHSGEENDIRAARFASRAAQELLLLRRY